MKQVWIIHGGNSFSSYEGYLADLKSSTITYEYLKPSKRWSSWLADELTGYDVLTPSFPNKFNAQFDEWKIYFEKLIPFFSDDVTLVGHSLGAMFLAIYLNQSKLPEPTKKLVLLAGGYDDNSNEDLGSFQVKSATGLEQSAENIYLFHSKDDPVVPFAELEKFQKDLPAAETHIFENRGHFIDETFPELLDVIKK